MSYKYSPPEGTTPSATRSDLADEFKRWNTQAGELVVSDYDLPMQRPGDKDAAVRFLLRGAPVDVKVTKWGDFATNLRCCYLVIREMRLAEARGVDGAMRDAYLQLPGGKTERDPYEVLGVRSDQDLEDIEAMYRAKAKRLHPDGGGSEDAMRELNAAVEKIREERKAVAR